MHDGVEQHHFCLHESFELPFECLHRIIDGGLNGRDGVGHVDCLNQ